MGFPTWARRRAGNAADAPDAADAPEAGATGGPDHQTAPATPPTRAIPGTRAVRPVAPRSSSGFRPAVACPRRAFRSPPARGWADHVIGHKHAGSSYPLWFLALLLAERPCPPCFRRPLPADRMSLAVGTSRGSRGPVVGTGSWPWLVRGPRLMRSAGSDGGTWWQGRSSQERARNQSG